MCTEVLWCEPTLQSSPPVPSLAAWSTDQPESFSFPAVAMGIVALEKQLMTQTLLPNLR